MPEAVRRGSKSLTRKALGWKLKGYRIQAGKSAGDVQEAGIVSRPTLYRMEAGESGFEWPRVRALGELYGVGPAELEQLVSLARASNGKGWTETFNMPEHLGLYADLETSASQLLMYEPDVIPAVLQTVDYGTALLRLGGRLPEPEVQRRLAFRKERQQRTFSGPHRKVLRCVLGETALRQGVGTPAIRADQIRHLKSFGGTVEIVYRPHSRGPHPYVNGPFAIMSFSNGELPRTVYVENIFDQDFLETATDVEQHEAAFESLYAQSVPIEEYTE